MQIKTFTRKKKTRNTHAHTHQISSNQPICIYQHSLFAIFPKPIMRYASHQFFLSLLLDALCSTNSDRTLIKAIHCCCHLKKKHTQFGFFAHVCGCYVKSERQWLWYESECAVCIHCAMILGSNCKYFAHDRHLIKLQFHVTTAQFFFITVTQWNKRAVVIAMAIQNCAHLSKSEMITKKKEK